MCAGTFTPSPEAAKLTRAPHAGKPSTPVTVRYSDSTGVPTEFHESMWGPVFTTFAAAMAKLVDGLPAGAKIAVIPEGPYVLARVAV